VLELKEYCRNRSTIMSRFCKFLDPFPSSRSVRACHMQAYHYTPEQIMSQCHSGFNPSDVYITSKKYGIG